MSKAILCLVVLSLVGQVLSDGKEKQPRLNLAILTPKKHEEKHETKKESKQTVSTCYNGYTLRKDGKCVKEISEPATEISDMVNVPYLDKCPHGLTYSKKGCSSSTEVSLEYYCPVGWQDDGSECAIVEPGEMTLRCITGDFIDGKCVSVHTVPQIITSRCPDGSSVEADGNCWKVIGTFDCTPPVSKEKDKKGTKKTKLRSLGEKNDNKKLDEEKGAKHEHEDKKGKKKPEVLKEMVVVTAPRPTKVGVASQLCEKKIQTDALAIVSCPEGFTDIGGACSLEEVSAPVNVCVATGSTDGDCPSVSKFAPKYARCPTGSQKEKDRCVQTTVVPSLKVCAEGWTDSGEGCFGHLDIKPGLECRPGLTLVDSACVGQLVRPSISLTLQVPEECDVKY